MAEKERLFSGEVFELIHTFRPKSTKREANYAAKSFRDEGYLARITFEGGRYKVWRSRRKYRRR